MKDDAFATIIADPPWSYSNTGVEGSAARTYPTMTDDEIRALDIPAADDAVLFLWATWPKLDKALSIPVAWGFQYVTGLPWVKVTDGPYRDLWGEFQAKPQYGTGFWVRGCSEPLLIAKRGNAKPKTGDLVGLISKNFGHSRKPENVYDLAERYPGPYLEMFARRPRPGWERFGNEVEGSVTLRSQEG